MVAATRALSGEERSETTRHQKVVLSNVGVKYRIIPESARTLKGRIFSMLQRNQTSEFWALKDVSLELLPGQVVGIVGRNGSGKSTLLRVMAGAIDPSHGTVSVDGRLHPLLDVAGAFNAELTGRENVYLNAALYRIDRSQVDELVPKILSFSELGIFFDLPVKTYSSGMVARLGFAVSTIVDPEILLLDEVLSVGDQHFQRKSYARMRQMIDRGAIVVLVSHFSELIERLCNRVIYLEGGRVQADGTPAEVLAAYHRDAMILS